MFLIKNYYKFSIFLFVLFSSAIFAFVVLAACTEVCLDFDGDDYGSPASSACPQPGFDCDDTNDLITTGTLEIPLNGNCQGGIDDDCDGYTDCDDSGCFTDIACLAVLPVCPDFSCDTGENCNNCWSDCPSWGNSVCDVGCNECPGGINENLLECGCGNWTTECGEECDDGNLVNGDGCNSLCQNEVVVGCVDGDGDGFDDIDPIDCPTGDDCNDSNFNIKPGVAEQCDATDWNCSGDDVEGLDLELCQRACLAADISNRWSGNGGNLNCCGNTEPEGPYLSATEANCGDGRDNDCDGKIDLVVGNEDEDCMPCLPTTFDNERLWFVGGEPDCDQCNHDGDDSGFQSNVSGEWLVTYPATPEMADQCDSDCNAGIATTVHINDYEVLEVSCGDGIDNDCDGDIDSGPGCTNFCTFPATLPCTIFP